MFLFQNFKNVAPRSVGFHGSNERLLSFLSIFLHVISFLLVAFKVFSLPLVLSNLIMTLLVWFSFGTFCLRFVESLKSLGYIFYQICEILARIFPHVFVSSSSWDSTYKHIKYLVLSQSSLIFCLLSSVFFLSYFISDSFCCNAFKFTDLFLCLICCQYHPVFNVICIYWF